MVVLVALLRTGLCDVAVSRLKCSALNKMFNQGTDDEFCTSPAILQNPLLCAVKFRSKMFKVGQKVVCIKSTTSGSVNEGEIYTVIWVGNCRYTGEVGVRLKEATPANGKLNFSACRFREIDESWVDELLSKLIEEVEADELVSAL